MSEEAIKERREYQKQYRLLNKENINKRHKEWRNANKEKIKEYNKNYWEKVAQKNKLQKAN